MVLGVSQKPVELILARNLMASLSTPAFLVDEGGTARLLQRGGRALLGKRFEELGKVGPEKWGPVFGPFDEDGEPIPYEELPLVEAVREAAPRTRTSRSAPPTARSTRSRLRRCRS